MSHATISGVSLAPGTLTDRRAARRAQTERALRAAAVDLAEERGFDRFTVDEVAQRAGVSPRTFFNYFPTKEAAVLGDPTPVLDAMSAAFAANADESMSVAIRATIKAFLDVSTEESRGVRRELALIESQPSLRIALLTHYCAYERRLGACIAERMGTTVSDDPLPLVLAASAVATSRITLVRWSWTTEPKPDLAVVDQTLAQISALLSTTLPE